MTIRKTLLVLLINVNGLIGKLSIIESKPLSAELKEKTFLLGKTLQDTIKKVETSWEDFTCKIRWGDDILNPTPPEYDPDRHLLVLSLSGLIQDLKQRAEALTSRFA